MAATLRTPLQALLSTPHVVRRGLSSTRPWYGSYSDSKRWLRRQHKDVYVREAQRQQLRARSAFKLREIDEKYRLIFPGARCIDCGAAPGGWSQVLAEGVYSRQQRPLKRPQTADSNQKDSTSSHKSSQSDNSLPTSLHEMETADSIWAVDLLPMEPISGVTVCQMDFTLPQAKARLRALLGGELVDLIVSDMAPSFTGTHSIDHIRTMNLCEDALYFAQDLLRPGGAFVCKFIMGGTEREFKLLLQTKYTKVRVFKPKSSRADSSEAYFVCLGKR
ncbi:2' O-ribose methyltransferase [Dimargaris verticillata]|uniref:rRNA methyltransferase 2, mitochondrial n=1 Tax=Dimargaris verticillata TaxID=2761393 RepID=A0A9W8BA66_9FUNG|nr:2' O-ribose methyltransferase [Dimargaris verticillata]